MRLIVDCHGASMARIQSLIRRCHIDNVSLSYKSLFIGEASIFFTRVYSKSGQKSDNTDNGEDDVGFRHQRETVG